MTAKPDSAVSRPSDVVVMENVVRPDTVGEVELTDARYERLQRGQCQHHFLHGLVVRDRPSRNWLGASFGILVRIPGKAVRDFFSSELDAVAKDPVHVVCSVEIEGLPLAVNVASEPGPYREVSSW